MSDLSSDSVAPSGTRLGGAAACVIAKSESVPCPLCGEVEVDVLFAGDGFAMGKCKRCRLVRQNPRITEGWKHKHGIYRMQVRHDSAVEYPEPPTRKKKYSGLEPWQSKPLEAYTESVRILDSVRGKRESKGIWLDVGASSGGYLIAARSNGWQVAGVEIRGSKANICKEMHNLDVFHGTLREAKYSDQYAEVVSYRHVLEHIYDLRSELSEVQRVLQADGLIFLEIPHYGGLKYKYDAARGRLGLMRKEDTLHNTPDHLYYFTADQIAALLQQAGFAPVYMRTYGRWRKRRGPFRRIFEHFRDELGRGNKIRVIARKS